MLRNNFFSGQRSEGRWVTPGVYQSCLFPAKPRVLCPEFSGVKHTHTHTSFLIAKILFLTI
jgi:hypothetical protein